MEADIVYRNESGVAVTTSYLIAETFGKEHRHVVRDIDLLCLKVQEVDYQCCPNLADVKSMFAEVIENISQPNGGYKEMKSYVINRDGFTLLAMGYTGKKAMTFKLKYIAAFNSMEKQLSQGITKSLESFSRKQILQMALEAEEEKERLAARLAISESKNLEMEVSIKKILPRLEAIESRMADSVAPEIIVKEGIATEDVGQLSVYQRAHAYEKDKIKSMFPSYVTLTEAIEKIKKKGIYTGRVELFEYLRTNGYLSSNPYTYNCPEEHCMRKGWMLASYGGAFNDRPKTKRMYVPYLSPKFVTLLEQMLREQLKKTKKKENTLFKQEDYENK